MIFCIIYLGKALRQDKNATLYPDHLSKTPFIMKIINKKMPKKLIHKIAFDLTQKKKKR